LETAAAAFRASLAIRSKVCSFPYALKFVLCIDLGEKFLHLAGLSSVELINLHAFRVAPRIGSSAFFSQVDVFPQLSHSAPRIDILASVVRE